jgi:hypothetical protein
MSHPKRVNVTTDKTLYPTQNGNCYQIDASGGVRTILLYPAYPGQEYTFFATDATNNIGIDPGRVYGAGADDQIYEAGTGKGAGKYLILDTAGESVRLKCVAPGRWEAFDVVGTLTYEP